MAVTTPLRALVVEDNPADVVLLLRALRRAGYDEAGARCVQTEADYVASLHAGLDVILSDYSLPQFDAPRALALLQETGLDIPFIVVTGTISEEVAVECMKSGASDYLLKDRLSRLGQAVAAALKAKRTREERQQAMVAADREKDLFLAMVSHELRSPLNAILGWAQLLQVGRLDEATVPQAIDAILRNAKAQALIIDDLMDMSRTLSEKLRLDLVSLDPAQVVRTALDATRVAAEAKAIRFETAIDPKVGRLVGDPIRLQQVVWNLLSNAVKFTPKGGRVDVRLERVGGDARLTVRDTGQGIAAGFLPQVFERFCQEDDSYSRAHGGLGLGLTIVRQLVELHGGTVRAESPGEGLGATFTVTLPLAPAGDTSARDAAPHDSPTPGVSASAGVPSLAGIRILVADDDADARAMLGLALERCGADVKGCASAPEALGALAGWRPDVLVSDIGMPGQDGYELMRRVRALGPERGGDVPAVALTGYTGAVDRRRALAAGFQAHVAKPVILDELVTAIATLVGQHV